MIRFIAMLPYPLLRLVYRNPVMSRIASRILRARTSVGKQFSVTVKNGPLKGKKLLIDDTVPNYYWIKGHDEPEVLHAMMANVKAGYRVVDIGAHVGIETLLFSQLVGPRGQVVSIEPDPKNFHLLEENIRLHQVANVQLMEVAVSNQKGYLPFYHNKGVTSRLVRLSGQHNSDHYTVLSVQVITLDEMFEGKGVKIDFVKIDVEDFEVEVLDGARQFLEEQHPTLLVELHSYRSARNCFDILNKLGYRLELVQPPTEDVERFLASQQQSSYEQGFQRCHLLARYLNWHN